MMIYIADVATRCSPRLRNCDDPDCIILLGSSEFPISQFSERTISAFSVLKKLFAKLSAQSSNILISMF